MTHRQRLDALVHFVALAAFVVPIVGVVHAIADAQRDELAPPSTVIDAARLGFPIALGLLASAIVSLFFARARWKLSASAISTTITIFTTTAAAVIAAKTAYPRSYSISDAFLHLVAFTTVASLGAGPILALPSIVTRRFERDRRKATALGLLSLAGVLFVPASWLVFASSASMARRLGSWTVDPGALREHLVVQGGLLAASLVAAAYAGLQVVSRPVGALEKEAAEDVRRASKEDAPFAEPRGFARPRFVRRVTLATMITTSLLCYLCVWSQAMTTPILRSCGIVHPIERVIWSVTLAALVVVPLASFVATRKRPELWAALSPVAASGLLALLGVLCHVDVGRTEIQILCVLVCGTLLVPGLFLAAGANLLSRTFERTWGDAREQIALRAGATVAICTIPPLAMTALLLPATEDVDTLVYFGMNLAVLVTALVVACAGYLSAAARNDWLTRVRLGEVPRYRIAPAPPRAQLDLPHFATTKHPMDSQAMLEVVEETEAAGAYRTGRPHTRALALVPTR